jgi:hypothetical protein
MKAPHRKHRSALPRGIVTLELILTLPIFIIMLLMMIEVAQIMMVNQNVSYASRFGAKLASEDITIENMNTPPASRLRTEIDKYLATANVPTGACKVILEHNASAVGTLQEDEPPGGGCDCSPPGTPLPSDYSVRSVRVTVCVPLEGNVPDFLSMFGFSVEPYTIEHSTTFRVE